MKTKILRVVFSVLLTLLIPVICTGKTYYISPSGQNTNNGSILHPFKTINHALEKMNSGDTCKLRKGTYREKIVIDKKGITICAYQDEYVLITGCELIEKRGEEFTIPGNNETCTRIKIDQKVHQLFIDGKRMNIARWPNKTASMLSMKDWENSWVDASNENKTVTIPSISFKSKDFWKGGYYIGMNSETPKLATWFSGGGQIISSSGDIIHISNTCYGVGSKYANGNGLGYILNCLNALDVENEWYWDNGYLYFKYPNGKIAEDSFIEARTKVYILDVAADNVNIHGINFKAGAALVNGNNVNIEKCTFRYTSPFVWNSGNNEGEAGARCNWGDYKNGSSGICILGNGLFMKDCYIAHSWFNGIVLWGDSCNIKNCIIEDVNWIAKRCAGINSYGADNIIRYCTIKNTGASSIEGGNANWLGKYAIRNIWEHNRCENACKIVVDQGFFYVNHQNGDAPFANSEWRYNFLIHNRGPDKGNWTNNNVGLYVDNSSSGYQVHHNVVVDCKEGMRYNDTREKEKAGKKVYFYNNVFYKVDHCMAYQFWNNTRLALPDAEVVVENNLSINCGGYGDRDHKKVFGASNAEFADISSVNNPENLDFLLNDTVYIDSGKLIENVGIDFFGKQPDIGAFEVGITPWEAGANLTIPKFFDEGENL